MVVYVCKYRLLTALNCMALNEFNVLLFYLFD